MAVTDFVVYENDSECLVTTLASEEQFLKEYGVDRNFDEDYDRTVKSSFAIQITPTFRMSS